MSHPSCAQAHAAPAVLRLCCSCCVTNAVLPPLCCSCCAAPLLPLLCYLCCAAPAVSPMLRYPCCVAPAVLLLLCCPCCAAPAVLPLLCCPFAAPAVLSLMCCPNAAPAVLPLCFRCLANPVSPLSSPCTTLCYRFAVPKLACRAQHQQTAGWESHAYSVNEHVPCSYMHIMCTQTSIAN